MFRIILLLGVLLFIDNTLFAQSYGRSIMGNGGGSNRTMGSGGGSRGIMGNGGGGGGIMSSVRRNIYGFRFGGSNGNIFNNNSRRLQNGYGSFTQSFSRPYRRRLSFRKITQEMYGTRMVRFRNQPLRAGFSRSGFSPVKKNNTHYKYSRINQDYEPLALPPKPLSLQNQSQRGFERF